MTRSIRFTEAELNIIVNAIRIGLEDGSLVDIDDLEGRERAERVIRKCREAFLAGDAK